MIIKKFLKGLDHVTDFWISFTLATMLLVILLDIIMREFFNAPLTWHLELSQYCLINVTYIGAAVAHRHRDHISINLFTSMLPPKKEKFVNLIGKCHHFALCFHPGLLKLRHPVENQRGNPFSQASQMDLLFALFLSDPSVCAFIPSPFWSMIFWRSAKKGNTASNPGEVVSS